MTVPVGWLVATGGAEFELVGLEAGSTAGCSGKEGVGDVTSGVRRSLAGFSNRDAEPAFCCISSVVCRGGGSNWEDGPE